jgi:TolA-binding protein
MKFPTLAIAMMVALAAPMLAPAASKEMQELQRDVAILQQQVKDLQKSQDEKLAAITELARQAIEAANRANTGVAVISSNLDKNLKDQTDKIAAPVVGVSTRVNDMGAEIHTLSQAMGDLTSTLNRMQAQLTDMGNAVKVMQAPPVAPPPQPGGSSAPSAAAPANDAPPMGMEAMYNGARQDYVGGKYDLAVQEFADYLKYYGNSNLAPNAQFYIAMIHFPQGSYETAVKEFDLVLEKYQDNPKTAESMLFKGRALVKLPGHKTDGANEFMEVIRRFPRTETAAQACDDRKSLGLNCGAPAAAPARSTAKKKR